MSVASDADYLDERAGALEDLRAARRRKRIDTLDKFEAFYKAYLTAVLGGVGMYAAAGWLGNEPVAASTLDVVRSDARFYLGILVALLVAIGLRSGGRGGPLAVELADVRHVLLAPVDRRDSVRSLAMRALRHGAFVGACVGAASGVVALRRLPGNPVEWVVGAVLFGACAVAVAYGIALMASGLRMKAWVADVLGVALLAWASLAALVGVELSPFTWIGALATAPLEFDPWMIAGVATVALVVGFAYVTAEGLSVETAERRSRLIGNLRFAATTQDVRTVMLIQRQLAQQTLRARPWIRLRPLRRAPAGPTLRVSLRRSMQSFLRWPAMRVARLLLLTGVSAACVAGLWAGTTALVVPAALALWLAATDLVEPLAQEADRPDRLKSLPVDRGLVSLRSLVLPVSIMFVLVMTCAGIFVTVSDSEIARELLPVVVPTVLCSVGGAAIAVTRSASYTSGSAAIFTPEIAGLAFIWKVGMPPAIAVLGMLPLAVGHTVWVDTGDLARVGAAMNLPFAAAMVAATWALLWVRYEDRLREAFTPAVNQAKNTSGDQK